MKNKKLTAITLMLASATLFGAMGAGLFRTNALADDATTVATYALSDVFTATETSRNVTAETIGEGDAAYKVTAFALKDEESAKIKRSLALKWYEKEENSEPAVQYFNTTFAFKELNFESVTLSMDTASAWATKENKATNSVQFTVDGSALKVSVNDGDEHTVSNPAELKLELAQENDARDGEFTVLLNGDEIGTFENVGANYASYTANKSYPMTFKAEAAEGVVATVLLYDINGQSFDNLTDENKVQDDAAPIFVVNEEVNSFLLGGAFALDYTVIDVLKTKSLDNDLTYYQYNPSATEANYEELTTSVYFMDTVYYKDGDIATTVAKENNGNEFVSIKMTTSDGSNNAATYDLAWYASTTKTIGDITYVPVNKTKNGATYKYIEANDTDKENKIVNATEYEKAKKAFEDALEAAAEEVYAGSNSYLYFPSLEWLFKDDNGYRNLKFSISYRVEGTQGEKTSTGLSYNGIKLAVESEGLYEFKIFANDKAGNTMQYYVDGEKVSVTTANIWDVENVPTFSFQIKNRGLKVEDPIKALDRRDTEILDKTYTLEDLKVVGASTLKEDYKLYRVDLEEYNDWARANDVIKKLSRSDLSAITYAQLAEKVDVATAVNGNYFEVYLTAYATLLAGEGASSDAIEAVKACFKEIKEYDSRITEDNAPDEWNEYNKFNWSADNQSFTTAEEGTYLIMADYWEAELAASQRAAAYQVIIVESEADVIKGENNWLKNNVVSVVLFAFAGVCLIALIVLLLVKPSNETLDDIDAKAEKTAKKSSKKKED